MKKTIEEILNDIHDINVCLLTDKNYRQMSMQDNTEVIMTERRDKQGESDKVHSAMEETSGGKDQTIQRNKRKNISLEQDRSDLIKEWLLSEAKEPHYSEDLTAHLTYRIIRDIVVPDLEYLRSMVISAEYPKDSAKSDV